MDIYFFVKYNNETNPEHIEKYAKTNATLCFDFEDSIENWIAPEANHKIKEEYRSYFKSIYNNILSRSGGIKTGIRINNDPTEIIKDFKAISKYRINSILIPKVETSDQVQIISQLCDEHNVIFDELVPIIESPAGISNLPEIIQSVPQKIRRIGFGHCDYNYKSGIFPFIHQNSTEYWKWVKRIISIAGKYNIGVINSAYLELGNSDFFEAMLQYSDEISGNNCGQFTLTTRQTNICNAHRRQQRQNSSNKLLKIRLDLSVPEQYAAELVEKFETENNNRGFALSKADQIIISPQEYLSAKSHIARKKSATINFTFTGGCFPVQHDILFEDLFHQRLKRKLENENHLNFNINIIRYETFNNCFDKIITYHKSKPVDILVFHIRPEPFLRLIKFYYKYVNNEGRPRRSLNLPFLKIINPEKYDLLVLGRRFEKASIKNDSAFHKMLVNLNYKTGFSAGNMKYALKKYSELVNDVINYCHSVNIKVILLGPALRRNTSFEAVLSEKLDSGLRNNLKYKDIVYIDGIDRDSANSASYFKINGIHATEAYHELISGRLYNEIVKGSG